MSKRTLLMGIRPTMNPESYSSRIARFEALQSDYRCFVLVADCEAAMAPGKAASDLEAGVACTFQFLIDRGFDAERSICFLQSQIPQLAELSRLTDDGPFSGNTVVTDMLMFRPARILGGVRDGDSYEEALRLQSRFGDVFLAKDAEFEAIPEHGGSVFEPNQDDGQQTTIRDILNYGGSTARIEAQKTLEVVREVVGLNYTLFK